MRQKTKSADISISVIIPVMNDWDNLESTIGIK